MTRQSQLRFEGFAKSLLIEEFGDRSPVHYLYGYLSELAATSVVIEDRYVDRHFVDDFAAYYARSFSPDTAAPPRRLVALPGSTSLAVLVYLLQHVSNLFHLAAESILGRA